MIGTCKNARTYKKSYCKGCGREIKWVKGRDWDAKAIPVEPHGCYYLPTEDGAPFIMSDGRINHGVIAPDGILGYRRHECERFARKILTERELVQRSWA